MTLGTWVGDPRSKLQMQEDLQWYVIDCATISYPHVFQSKSRDTVMTSVQLSITPSVCYIKSSYTLHRFQPNWCMHFTCAKLTQHHIDFWPKNLGHTCRPGVKGPIWLLKTTGTSSIMQSPVLNANNISSQNCKEMWRYQYLAKTCLNQPLSGFPMYACFAQNGLHFIFKLTAILFPLML